MTREGSVRGAGAAGLTLVLIVLSGCVQESALTLRNECGFGVQGFVQLPRKGSVGWAPWSVRARYDLPADAERRFESGTWGMSRVTGSGAMVVLWVDQRAAVWRINMDSGDRASVRLTHDAATGRFALTGDDGEISAKLVAASEIDAECGTLIDEGAAPGRGLFGGQEPR